MSSHSERLLLLPSGSSSGAVSRGPREGLNISQCGRKRRGDVRDRDEDYGCATTADTLPDDVLIEIFNSCRINGPKCHWNWERLVNVCRRWRRIIFASSRHLHLQLCCDGMISVRKYLDFWPAFPIAIHYHLDLDPKLEDSAFAALEHHNRVCSLFLIATGPQFERLATVMRGPFPALKHLKLLVATYEYRYITDPPVLPGGFLGGSAPCLQDVVIEGIPLPELPTLLLSARDLITLQLTDIPGTSCMSPESMVRGLAALTGLRSLTIGFKPSSPRVKRTHLHPVIRAVFPALTSFRFEGGSDYSEDLVTRIDCPRLSDIDITYRGERDDFQVSELFKFIDRSEDPRLTQVGWVDFSSACGEGANLKIYHADLSDMAVLMYFRGKQWRSSHVVQVLGRFTAKLLDARHLYVRLHNRCPELGYNEWVQILHPFAALQTLWVSGYSGGYCVSLALKDIIAAKSLPSLDLLCLSNHSVSLITDLDADLRLSGHPVTCIRSVREFDEWVKPYLGKSKGVPSTWC